MMIPRSAPENMYVYDGEDYSKPSEADSTTFDLLLAGGCGHWYDHAPMQLIGVVIVLQSSSN